jgi:hypothetical protein
MGLTQAQSLSSDVQQTFLTLILMLFYIAHTGHNYYPNIKFVQSMHYILMLLTLKYLQCLHSHTCFGPVRSSSRTHSKLKIRSYTYSINRITYVTNSLFKQEVPLVLDLCFYYGLGVQCFQ